MEHINIDIEQINLGEYSDIGTHWIALYVNSETLTLYTDIIYFDSFQVEQKIY